MTLIELKKIFLHELKETFPVVEIESFFFLLTEHHLNKRRLDFGLEPEYKVDPQTEALFKAALAQLKKEYPIQYIIGSTEFLGLSFEINEHVLIPRPETEELVTWVLNSNKHIKHLRILDIGTGSGCIPIALAKNLDKANIDAIDLSEAALLVAKKNAALNGVHINFIQNDILQVTNLDKTYDLIISNPPYVRESEKLHMHNNVLKYEPEIALFVDDQNPLIFYKRIAHLAQLSLKEGGELFLEINQYLGKPLKELLKNNGFIEIEIKKDFYDADRMIRAVKN